MPFLQSPFFAAIAIAGTMKESAMMSWGRCDCRILFQYDVAQDFGGSTFDCV